MENEDRELERKFHVVLVDEEKLRELVYNATVEFFQQQDRLHKILFAAVEKKARENRTRKIVRRLKRRGEKLAWEEDEDDETRRG